MTSWACQILVSQKISKLERVDLNTILQLVTDYGYFALYGLLALGIIGIPVPDETLMTIAGTLAAHGTLSYTWSVLICFAGSMTGMLVSYSIGRQWGKPFLYRFGKLVYLTPGRIRKVERWFQRYGVWTVSFGYFMPGVRHLTCYLAGVSGIRIWRYLLFAGSGAIVWCVTFITLGYVLRENWQAITEVIHQYAALIALSAVMLFVIALFLVKMYKMSRKV